MKLTQVYRAALIAIPGFLMAATFHTGRAAQVNPPQEVRNIVIVTERGPMDQAGPK